jgi:small subunit ribosomal protein S18
MAPPSRPKRRTGEYSGRKFTPRRKVCAFCVDKIRHVDYKDIGRLRRFLSERSKIEPRRKTGTCAKHQRSLTIALKRARHLALLPYTAEHIRITGVQVREPGPALRPTRPGRPTPEESEAPAEAVAAASPDQEATPASTAVMAGTPGA